MNHPVDIYSSERLPSDVGAHIAKAVGSVHLEATIAAPNGQMISLGTLTMISVSTHREKYPVTSLSRVRPKGFTRGHRMIAGTLVFSVFQHSAFMSLVTPLQAPMGFADRADHQKQQNASLAFYNMSADELPPFDIHMVYVTPDGIVCYEGLRGVEVVDEGSVRSMEVPSIQESYSYMARERIPLQRLTQTVNPPPFTRTSLAANQYTNPLTNIDSVIENLFPAEIYGSGQLPGF